MSESEMTLERACEIMTEHRYHGLQWRVSHGNARGWHDKGDCMATAGEDAAIDIATRLEREATAEVKPEAAAPPPTPPSIPPIERPAHYARLTLQPFDAARAWGLGLALGSAVKYIARHQHKGDPIGDLRKAINCIRDEIEAIEKGRRNEQSCQRPRSWLRPACQPYRR